MKANQLAALVLRLLGIYCLIQVIPIIMALSSIIIIARTIEHSENPIFTTFVQASIPSLCWVALGVLLLVFSNFWGEKVAKGMGDEKMTEITFEQVQVLAFAGVGVLLLAEGLSQLFGNVYSVIALANQFHRDQHPEGMQYIDWRTLFSTLGNVLQAGLGAWMFFGARGFANFWHSARNFGTPKSPA